MKPNVIIVSIDCLRSDAVFGDNTDTRFFDSLRKRSTVFKSHHSTGAWTAPSFIGFMTGSHPRSHATDMGIEYYPETLAETMQDRGYSTIATLDSNYWISAAQGFDRGFDSFTNFVNKEDFEASKKKETAEERGSENRLAEILPESVTSNAPRLVDIVWDGIQSNETIYNTLRTAYRAATITNRSVGAETINGAFKNELHGVNEPVFGWVHYMDPHHPYLPNDLTGLDSLRYPSPRINLLNSRAVNGGDVDDTDIRSLRYLYNRVVEDTDQSLQSLVSTVQSTLDGQTIFVIVGDHGEEFGEHGKLTHANRPYEELIHVPLLVTDGTNRTVTDLTSSIGMKTAIQCLVEDDNYISHLRTDPVCRYIGGDSVPDRTRLALNGFDNVSEVHTKISNQTKCMYDGGFETYDLESDPGETKDVTQYNQHSELMRETIREQAIERRQLADQRILGQLD